MSVLIIGNVIKDIYLRLDDRTNNFELDDKGVFWLDLSFNGETHTFFRRNSVYGGAAVTLEVLNKFGIDATISGSNMNYQNGELIFKQELAQNYRYILCHDDETVYFSPSTRAKTSWTNPDKDVDWIFVDRSANITDNLIDNLQGFLAEHKNTKLAVYADRNLALADLRLLKMANLIFAEEPDKNIRDLKKPTCIIMDDKIKIGETAQEWHLPRKDLLTHLTAHSIIAATIFSALLQGKTIQKALLFAKTNIENSSLSSTLSEERIEELAE